MFSLLAVLVIYIHTAFNFILWLTVTLILSVAIIYALSKLAGALYLNPHVVSKNVKEKTKLIIIGAGFSGIGAAYKLNKTGFSNYLILERRSELGGTWFDNTYPGAACDVPSAVYSFSFFLYSKWTESHASSSEILTYLKEVAQKFGIIKKIKFNQNVVSCIWDEKTKLWNVKTEKNEEYLADFILQCSGPLMVPKYPQIPGEAFTAGPSYHSSRWDNKFDFFNKTVGLIGTGASAVQIVPSLAQKVKQITVFQRTPAWVSSRAFFVIPLWVQYLYSKLPFLMKIHRLVVYLLSEFFYFLVFSGIWSYGAKLAKSKLTQNIELILNKKPELISSLIPKYELGCKRVTPSNAYLQTFLKNNVSLVTSKIVSITKDGLITEDGIERKFDVLVYATGFDVRASMVGAFEVIGKNDINFQESLGMEPQAYFGTAYSGFPNYFSILGPNTGLGHNSIIFISECLIDYVIDKITYTLKNGYTTIEVKESAIKRYNTNLQNRLKNKVWSSGCTAWYLSASGFNWTLWPDSSIAFWIRSLEKNYSDFIYE